MTGSLRTIHVALVDGSRVLLDEAGRLPTFIQDAADRTPALLAPWRAAFPDADFDRAVELAPLADTVFQTVTFDQLSRAGEAGTGDLDGVVLMLTRKVLASVAGSRG